MNDWSGFRHGSFRWGAPNIFEDKTVCGRIGAFCTNPPGRTSVPTWGVWLSQEGGDLGCVQEVNQSIQRLFSNVMAQGRQNEAWRVKFTCGQVGQPKMLLPPSETENLEGGQTEGQFGVCWVWLTNSYCKEKKKNHKSVALRKLRAMRCGRNVGLPISYMLTTHKSRKLGELSQGKV